MMHATWTSRVGARQLHELIPGFRTPFGWHYFADGDPAGGGGAAGGGDPGQQTGDASRQPSPGAGEPARSEPASETVSKADFDKVSSQLQEAIGDRQAAKEARRQSDERIAALEKQLKVMPDPEALKAFEAWKADKGAQARDKAMKDGDVEAIEAGVRTPLLAQIEAGQARVTGLEGQLTTVMVDQALRKAAVDSGAHSPEQVVQLLRHRVTMKEVGGRYVPSFQNADGTDMYDDKGQRVTEAPAFVTTFLQLADNANLVKAQATPGSGAQPQGAAAGSDTAPTTLDEFNALSDEQKAYWAQKFTPEERKRMLGIETERTGAFL